ncbi:hypothetical protein TIFTF001_046094 [Ficus carica]|uniref:Uncharacterized protein n=1 Tax=Ficus carica TaxID=3494 RepID=A0AA88CQB4_FICCA|nr:hypothetical protein TIFTF001_046094 [Ficus carica]
MSILMVSYLSPVPMSGVLHAHIFSSGRYIVRTHLATCLRWSRSAGNRHPHVQSGQVSQSHGLLGLTHAHWIFRTATPPNQAVNARSHAQLTLSGCLAKSGSTQGHANTRHPLASRTQWPWW